MTAIFDLDFFDKTKGHDIMCNKLRNKLPPATSMCACVWAASLLYTWFTSPSIKRCEE